MRRLLPAERLARLGVPLDRPFTRRQAIEQGVSPRMLRRLIEEGQVVRPVHGVLQAAELGDSPALRAQALSLVVPGDAVICDRHAAWLWGATMALHPGEHEVLGPVSVFRPSGHGRVRTALADSGERNLLPGDVTTVRGLRVTTGLRTAHDLGRQRDPYRALANLDAVARACSLTRGLVLRDVERYAGMRWVTTLRAVAPLVDARAESPPESILRLVCHEVGADGLVPQVEVRDDGVLVGRIDLADRDLMLAVEYDGRAFHSTEEQTDHDERRRAWLRSLGWTVLVVRAEHLFGPGRVDLEARIREAVLEARQRRSRLIRT